MSRMAIFFHAIAIQFASNRTFNPADKVPDRIKTDWQQRVLKNFKLKRAAFFPNAPFLPQFDDVL